MTDEQKIELSEKNIIKQLDRGNIAGGMRRDLALGSMADRCS